MMRAERNATKERTMAQWIADDALSEQYPVYTRGNVGEVFPVVVMPLTWEFADASEGGWRDAYRWLGVLLERDMADAPPRTIVSCHGGYAYLNVSYLRCFATRTPGLTVEELDRQFFGDSEAPAYVRQRGDRSLLATVRIGRTLIRTLRTRSLPALEQDKEIPERYWQSLPPDLVTATDDELMAASHAFLPPFRALFDRHIRMTFQATIGRGVLAKICAEHLGDPAHVNRLLVGIGDVESAQPAQAMWELSRMEPGSEAFEAGLAGFLKRYGSRGPNEWDPSADTWETDPRLVVRAVDAMRGADPSREPRLQQQRLAAERDDAVAALRARLGRAERLRFDLALRSATAFSQGRERSKTTAVKLVHGLRMVQREQARRGRERGGPTDLQDMWLLTLAELPDYLRDPASFLEVLAERKALQRELEARVPPFVFAGPQPHHSTWERRGTGSEAPRAEAGDELTGIAGSPGLARGRARVVRSPLEPGDLGPGDVLVAPITDPSWTPLFVPVEGVICEVGAEMSHAVIVARELGIPAVVSVAGATRAIPDGALVEVDGNRGTVTVLPDAPG